MKLNEIKTSKDVYRFIDDNIAYGWIDINNQQHLNTMKEFRRIYRTMSVEEILKYKLGTCIEQVNLMHYLLNKINVKNKMYCCRIFEPDDYGNLEEEEHMHCFILYYENGKVYHMEHPNLDRKGIYEYNSESEAIKAIVDYYIELRGGKESPTKEFFEVPVGISFKEFNKYINHV
ncbi:MAG: transglutaminase domain-containing protein [Clostridia bacterium]|nr:transglutaminase domain-containing protein [Clostridia bacterium]